MISSDYIKLRMIEQYRSAKALGKAGKDFDECVIRLNAMTECAAEYGDTKTEKLGDWLDNRIRRWP